MDVHLRSANMDEIDQIADLWVDLAHHQEKFGSNLRAQSNRTRIRESFSRRALADELLVATEGDEIVGFASISLEHRLFDVVKSRGIIENLYVLPRSRGNGIGGELLNEAETRLGKRGADIICLEALKGNLTARDFYERHGFSVHRVEYTKSIR